MSFFICILRKDKTPKLFELLLSEAYIFVHCMHCRYYRPHIFLIFHQVFAMLKLTPYDLSVDRLDVHAVSVLIQYCICYLVFRFSVSLVFCYFRKIIMMDHYFE